MKYKVTVPPTWNVGSYTTTAQAGYGQTYRQAALQDYNSVRAYAGLPPVKRMPKGTTYTPLYEYALQGAYGHGWEDLCVEDSRKECLERLKEYRENESGTYRIKRRAAN